MMSFECSMCCKIVFDCLRFISFNIVFICKIKGKIPINKLGSVILCMFFGNDQDVCILEHVHLLEQIWYVYFHNGSHLLYFHLFDLMEILMPLNHFESGPHGRAVKSIVS